MKKKFTFLLLIFVSIIGFMLPKNVFAEGASLKVITNVTNWKSNTDLVFNAGGSSVNVLPTVYVGADTDHLTEVSSNFNFNSLNFNSGDDFIIVEVYNFSSYGGNNVEEEEINIIPGKVSSSTISYDDGYVFKNYNPINNQTAYLYNMNRVDEANNVTGELYVSDAYFKNGGKSVELSLGTVAIYNYCVNIHFNVKGNIANAYDGTFYLNEFRTDQFTISGVDKDVLNICTINGVPLTKQQYDTLIATSETDVSYEGVDRESDYLMGVTVNTESDDGNGGLSTDIYVSATLESDGSQTGLLYTVFPFVILISLVVVGYLIIKNNQVKEDKEII